MVGAAAGFAASCAADGHQPMDHSICVASRLRDADRAMVDAAAGFSAPPTDAVGEPNMAAATVPIIARDLVVGTAARLASSRAIARYKSKLRHFFWAADRCHARRI